MGSEEVSVVSTPSRVLRPHPDILIDSPPLYDQPPDYHDNIFPASAVIIACSKGKVMGIDAETGETLWTYHCPGGRSNIPVVIIEPPSMELHRPDQLAYIGAAKWVYCLNTKTGDVVWSTKVASSLFGSDFMTLATAWSSRLAAESYSAYNQNPSLQCLELQRQRYRANAAARTSKDIGRIHAYN